MPETMITNEGKEVPYPRVGDTVVRLLAGVVPVEMKVTKIDEKLIHCGSWTFDVIHGVEVDDDLQFGLEYGRTGSYIQDVIRAEAQEADK